MTHRLFFGIRPSAHIRDALLDTMDGVDNARWQDDDQLHLTLRYIGEVDAHMADDLADAAQSVPFAPFDLSIDGCGVFERKGHARTLYAEIAPSAPLAGLQRRLERLCQRRGIEPEQRKFHPHITLARLNTATGPLTDYLQAHSGLSLGPWRVEHYILYESHLRDQGSLYEPVVTYSATP